VPTHPGKDKSLGNLLNNLLNEGLDRAPVNPSIPDPSVVIEPGPLLLSTRLPQPPPNVANAFRKELNTFRPKIEKVLGAHPRAVSTSNYRSPEHNAETPNAAKLSQHLVGLGHDVQQFGDDGQLDEKAMAAIIRTATDLGIVAFFHLEGPKRHVHMQHARAGVLSPRIEATLPRAMRERIEAARALKTKAKAKQPKPKAKG